MKRKRDPNSDRLLRGMVPPQPPPDLRSRVLQAACERATTDARADLWSRLWNNRGLRLAWASAATLLLAAHLVLGLGGQPSRAAVSSDPTLDRVGDGVLFDLLRPVRADERKTRAEIFTINLYRG